MKIKHTNITPAFTDDLAPEEKSLEPESSQQHSNDDKEIEKIIPLYREYFFYGQNSGMPETKELESLIEHDSSTLSVQRRAISDAARQVRDAVDNHWQASWNENKVRFKEGRAVPFTKPADVINQVKKWFDDIIIMLVRSDQLLVQCEAEDWAKSGQENNKKMLNDRVIEQSYARLCPEKNNPMLESLIRNSVAQPETGHIRTLHARFIDKHTNDFLRAQHKALADYQGNARKIIQKVTYLKRTVNSRMSGHQAPLTAAITAASCALEGVSKWIKSATHRELPPVSAGKKFFTLPSIRRAAKPPDSRSKPHHTKPSSKAPPQASWTFELKSGEDARYCNDLLNSARGIRGRGNELLLVVNELEHLLAQAPQHVAPLTPEEALIHTMEWLMDDPTRPTLIQSTEKAAAIAKGIITTPLWTEFTGCLPALTQPNIDENAGQLTERYKNVVQETVNVVNSVSAGMLVLGTELHNGHPQAKPLADLRQLQLMLSTALWQLDNFARMYIRETRAEWPMYFERERAELNSLLSEVKSGPRRMLTAGHKVRHAIKNTASENQIPERLSVALQSLQHQIWQLRTAVMKFHRTLLPCRLENDQRDKPAPFSAAWISMRECADRVLGVIEAFNARDIEHHLSVATTSILLREEASLHQRNQEQKLVTQLESLVTKVLGEMSSVATQLQPLAEKAKIAPNTDGLDLKLSQFENRLRDLHQSIKNHSVALTGNAQHETSREGMMAKSLGEWLVVMRREIEQAQPDLSASEVDMLEEQLLQGILAAQPQGNATNTALRESRIRQAAREVRTGGLMYPQTADEILARTPGMREYLRRYAESRLDYAIISNLFMYGPDMLSHLLPLSVAAGVPASPLRYLRLLLTPITVYRNTGAMMKVKPGEALSREKIRKYWLREAFRAGLRFASCFVPGGIKNALVLPIVALSLRDDKYRHGFTHRLEQRLAGDVTWSTLYAGWSHGLQWAVSPGREERALNAFKNDYIDSWMDRLAGLREDVCQQEKPAKDVVGRAERLIEEAQSLRNKVRAFSHPQVQLLAMAMDSQIEQLRVIKLMWQRRDMNDDMTALYQLINNDLDEYIKDVRSGELSPTDIRSVEEKLALCRRLDSRLSHYTQEEESKLPQELEAIREIRSGLLKLIGKWQELLTSAECEDMLSSDEPQEDQLPPTVFTAEESLHYREECEEEPITPKREWQTRMDILLIQQEVVRRQNELKLVWLRSEEEQIIADKAPVADTASAQDEISAVKDGSIHYSAHKETDDVNDELSPLASLTAEQQEHFTSEVQDKNKAADSGEGKTEYVTFDKVQTQNHVSERPRFSAPGAPRLLLTASRYNSARREAQIKGDVETLAHSGRPDPAAAVQTVADEDTSATAKRKHGTRVRRAAVSANPDDLIPAEENKAEILPLATPVSDSTDIPDSPVVPEEDVKPVIAGIKDISTNQRRKLRDSFWVEKPFSIEGPLDWVIGSWWDKSFTDIDASEYEEWLEKNGYIKIDGKMWKCSSKRGDIYILSNNADETCTIKYNHDTNEYVLVDRPLLKQCISAYLQVDKLPKPLRALVDNRIGLLCQLSIKKLVERDMTRRDILDYFNHYLTLIYFNNNDNQAAELMLSVLVFKRLLSEQAGKPLPDFNVFDEFDDRLLFSLGIKKDEPLALKLSSGMVNTDVLNDILARKYNSSYKSRTDVRLNEINSKQEELKVLERLYITVWSYHQDLYERFKRYDQLQKFKKNPTSSGVVFLPHEQSEIEGWNIDINDDKYKRYVVLRDKVNDNLLQQHNLRDEKNGLEFNKREQEEIRQRYIGLASRVETLVYSNARKGDYAAIDKAIGLLVLEISRLREEGDTDPDTLAKKRFELDYTMLLRSTTREQSIINNYFSEKTFAQKDTLRNLATAKTEALKAFYTLMGKETTSVGDDYEKEFDAIVLLGNEDADFLQRIAATLFYKLEKPRMDINDVRPEEIMAFFDKQTEDLISELYSFDISKRPSGYLSFDNFFNNQYFNDDSQYFQQFHNYLTGESIIYDTKLLTPLMLIQASLTEDELKKSPTQLGIYHLYARGSSSKFDAREKVPGIITVLKLSSGRYMYISNIMGKLKTTVLTEDEARRYGVTPTSGYPPLNILPNWSRMKVKETDKEAEHEFYKKILPTGVYNSDALKKNNGQPAFLTLATPKGGELEIIDLPVKEAVRVNLQLHIQDIIEDQKKNLQTHGTLEMLAESQSAIYREIYYSSKDPDHKVDTAAIVWECISLLFLLVDAGVEVAGISAATAKSAVEAVKVARALELTGAALARHVLKTVPGLLAKGGLHIIDTLATKAVNYVLPVGLRSTHFDYSKIFSGENKAASLAHSVHIEGTLPTDWGYAEPGRPNGELVILPQDSNRAHFVQDGYRYHLTRENTSADWRLENKSFSGNSFETASVHRLPSGRWILSSTSHAGELRQGWSTHIDTNKLTEHNQYENGVYYVRPDDQVSAQDYLYYIKQDNHIYEISFDESENMWRLVNPQNRKPSAYRLPVRQDETGRWTTHSEIGLRGGAPELPGTSSLKEHEPSDWLDLARTAPAEQQVLETLIAHDADITASYNKTVTKTHLIIGEANENSEKLKKIKGAKKIEEARDNTKYLKNKLADYAAHSSVMYKDSTGEVHYKDEFLNLPGKLKKNDMFPGVKVMTADEINALPGEHNDVMGYYKITEPQKYLAKIKELYASTGTPLHPFLEKKIESWLRHNKYIIPMQSGIAGLHAEVQALNFAISDLPEISPGNISLPALQERIRNTYIFTTKLTGKDKNLGGYFVACSNCSGIISFLGEIMTGRQVGAVGRGTVGTGTQAGGSWPKLIIGIERHAIQGIGRTGRSVQPLAVQPLAVQPLAVQPLLQTVLICWQQQLSQIS